MGYNKGKDPHESGYSMDAHASSYDSYRLARDASWRALLKTEHATLPVDAEALARSLGVQVFTRREAQAMPHLVRLLEDAPEGVCVSLRIGGQWYIFLRDGLPDPRRRFAVAHELGHILLSCPTRPLSPGVRVFQSLPATGDLMDGTEGTADCDADMFAIRLLAPACVLHELHIDVPSRIAALCALPPRAAAFRAERMALLNERNVFYTHSLECRVRDHFLPEIRSRRGFPVTEKKTRVIPAALPRAPEHTSPKKRGFPYAKAALLLGIVAGAILAYFLLR